MPKYIFCIYESLPKLFLQGELEANTVLINAEANVEWRTYWLEHKHGNMISTPKDESELIKLLAAQNGTILREKGILGSYSYVALVTHSGSKERIQKLTELHETEIDSELARTMGKLKADDIFLQGKLASWLVFKWDTEDLITILILFKNNPEAMEQCFNLAKEHILTFPIPDELRKFRGNQIPIHLADYDWIVEPNYIGPDKRKNPDGSLINSYSFVGKRKNLISTTGGYFFGFTDRMSFVMLTLFLLYVLFSVIDTYFSIQHISNGQLLEMNPLLEPLLREGKMWAFILFKNSISVILFLIISRFERHWWGVMLASFNMLIYLALDLYWLTILT